MVQKYEAIIHRDDRLSIIVNSKNPELSLTFQYVRKQKLFRRSGRNHFQQ